MYNRGKNVRNKGKRTEKKVAALRMQANWFYETDAKEMNAITVGNPYTLCVNCNLYTTLLPENASCHIRGLYRVFQICRVSLARLLFLGDSNQSPTYFPDNPIERVIANI